MYLSNENYHSLEANKHFFSNSQYKNLKECPSRAIAEIEGKHKRFETKAMIVSSFVDAYFSGTLAHFKLKYADEILTKQKKLKKDYRQAEYIIKRIERDKLFIKFLSGEKQVVMTREYEGIPIKICVDSYLKGVAIADLKIMADFKFQWKNRVQMNFIEFYGYDMQMAIYQYVIGEKIPCYIVAATKEIEPNLCIIQIEQDRLDYKLEQFKQDIIYLNKIKKGEIEAEKCMSCDWCKKNKQSDLLNFDRFDEWIRGGFKVDNTRFDNIDGY